jgi:TolB-like protein/DNA-binding winged helix-turn-helix (wHTH) protein/Flp pilus assembly protein TadD
VGNAFQVGSWLAEPSLNAISQNGKTLHVEPKLMEVLVCLAASPGETVSKEALIQKVWPDTFVTDDVLTRAISELRRAFEDDPKHSRVIQTIPKRGYRLVAPVVAVNGAAAVAPEPTAPIPGSTPDAMTARGGRRKLAVLSLGGALLALGLFAAAKSAWVRDRLGRKETPQIHSLAVLPLQNLSGDPNQEYFVKGLKGELITDLAKIGSLKVISGTSTDIYENSHKLLPEIARELNAEGIIQGTVQRSGDRVRITVQLIHGPSDKLLWANSYERDARDVLSMENEIAETIANQIQARLTPEQEARLAQHRPVNLKAHEAYLQGLHETNLTSFVANHEGMRPAAKEHSRRAVEYYQQAINEDPNYAPAYLGLADQGDPNDVEVKARKALELDDTLSEAHVELGAVLLSRDLDWRGAEKEFLRAIEVNPSYAHAHQGYAYYLDALGRLDEGFKEYHRTQELDPANDHLGAALYSRREYGPLIEHERRALATNPPGDTDENAVAHKVLMVAYARTGKRKESIEEMRSAVACMGYHDFAEEIRRGYVKGGYQGALRGYLNGLKAHPDWVFHWVDIYVYAELGDHDQAFARLSRLNKIDPGSWQFVGVDPDGFGILAVPTLAALRVEPMWDPLHSDPRFEALAKQIGLPAESAGTGKP